MVENFLVTRFISKIIYLRPQPMNSFLLLLSCILCLIHSSQASCPFANQVSSKSNAELERIHMVSREASRKLNDFADLQNALIAAQVPTNVPSAIRTNKPVSATPLKATVIPTKTTKPSIVPTAVPTAKLTIVPTVTRSSAPLKPTTRTPSFTPLKPSLKPSIVPTAIPSAKQSIKTTTTPSASPRKPSTKPSVATTATPSKLTVRPSIAPTVNPSASPRKPTTKPSVATTVTPTKLTVRPSIAPTVNPSASPRKPSTKPTILPTRIPSKRITAGPSILPTASSTKSPSKFPTTTKPSSKSPVGTKTPSARPSNIPSSIPSVNPTKNLQYPIIVDIEEFNGYSWPINFAEVQLFKDGQQWPNTLLNASASSFYSSSYAPAYLLDGNLDTAFSSADGDPFPRVTITAHVPSVDSIVIYNRVDCCQSFSVGSTITVTAGPWLLFQSTFAQDNETYTFSLPSLPTLINVSSSAVEIAQFSAGLSFKVCNDYFSDQPIFFRRCSLRGPVGVTSSISDVMTGTSNAFPGLDNSAQYSVLWTGFFIPDATGLWTFYTNSDDASYVWLGASTSEYMMGLDVETAFIKNGGIHGATVRTAVAYLTAGQVYKLSIAYGQSIYGQVMNFQFRGPKDSKSSSIFSSSGEGLFFHCTPSNVNDYGNDCVDSPPSANVAATDLTAGLSFDVCFGYFAKDVDYFSSCPLEAIGTTEILKSIQDGISYVLPDIYLEYEMSILWRGYFKPDVSGVWTFSLTARPTAYMWLGPLAVKGTSFEYNFMSSSNTQGGWDLLPSTASVYLKAGEYYDLKIMFGTYGEYFDRFTYNGYHFVEWNSANMSLSFLGPQGSAASLNGGTFEGKDFFFVNSSSTVEQRRPFVDAVDVSNMDLVSGLTFDTCAANLMNLIFTVNNGPYPNFACRRDPIVIRELPMATGLTNNIGDITSGVGNQIATSEFFVPSFTIEWRGFFRADVTGLWKFTIHASHNSFLWLGNSSLGFNQSIINAVVHNHRAHYFHNQIGRPPNQRSGVVYLKAGEYYPFFMIFAKQTYYVATVLNFRGPPGSISDTHNFADGRGFFFSHYPIESDNTVNSNEVTVGLNFKINSDYYLPFFPDNSSPLNQIFEINPFLEKLTSASSLYSGISNSWENLALLTAGYPFEYLPNFSVEWTGYFLPDAAGTWKFTINSDADFSCLWLGPAAVKGLNFYNGIVRHEGNISGNTAPIFETRVGSVLLHAGEYYPIRITYSSRRGAFSNLNIVFEGPIGSITFKNATSNSQGFLFSRSKESSAMLFEMRAGYFNGNPNFFSSSSGSTAAMANSEVSSSAARTSSPTRRPSRAPSRVSTAAPTQFFLAPEIAFLSGLSVSKDSYTIDFFTGVNQMWYGTNYFLGNFVSFNRSTYSLQFEGGDTMYCNAARYGKVFLTCGSSFAIQRQWAPAYCAYYFDVTVPDLCKKSGPTSSLDNLRLATAGFTTDFLTAAFSVSWTGLFLPDVSGVYTFSISSNNASAVWLGPSATINDWSNQNALIVNAGGKQPAQASAVLIGGQTYPIRIVYGTVSASGRKFHFSFRGPAGSAAHSNPLASTTISSLPSGFFKLPLSSISKAYPRPYYPGVCAKAPNRLPVSNASTICAAYKTTQRALAASLPPSSDRFGRSTIFGKVARLSWHDASEFDKRTYDMMGGDGCLDFGDTDSNSGLIEYDSLVNTYVEPMWQLVCDKISRGDFWNMIGNMVMELAEPTKQMKIPFYFGRKDSKLCRDGTGVLLGSTASTSLYNSVTFSKRLPTEQFGFPEILRTFVDQMGLTLADAVALIGAHTLGRSHAAFSGYHIESIDPSQVNFKTNAFDSTPDIFDNEYFQLFKSSNWKSVQQNDEPTFNHWELTDGTDLLRLNTDQALAFEIDVNSTSNQKCGYSAVTTSPCSPSQPCFGCTSSTRFPNGNRSHPSTSYLIEKYARNNSAFLHDFALAYSKAVTVGFDLRDGRFSGKKKLGTLTSLDLSKC